MLVRELAMDSRQANRDDGTKADAAGSSSAQTSSLPMLPMQFGSTRSVHRADHLLHTPDTFIRIALPGMQGAMAIVHIGPQAGAGFAQMTVGFEAGGSMEITEPLDAASIDVGRQRFLYVLDGALRLNVMNEKHELNAGSYAYVPHGVPYSLRAQSAAQVAVIEKRYIPAPSCTPAQVGAGGTSPQLLVGHESDVPSTPLLGDEDLQVRALLPDTMDFDFAVNTMTFAPGASLSMVEVHVMEHGLLMLAGGGIYRLGDHWYPVQAGDFIWMGPFCPQWFGALGKQPSKYLIYKDFHRHPLAGSSGTLRQP
jgi:(S)-ureidoglycine aminohydrolase